MYYVLSISDAYLSGLTGNVWDVGEDMVKSLQNTKYSVDEKLEKSFINLFSRKPGVSSESKADMEDKLDQESDSEDKDDSDSSSHDEHIGKDGMTDSSDEDNDTAAEQQQFSVKDKLKEQAEFHDGRMRRKAIFGDEVDGDDPMVSAISLYPFYQAVPYGAVNLNPHHL